MCKSNLTPIEHATIHIENDNIDITDNDDLKSFKVENSCYVNDRFIGTAVAKKITVGIFNDGKYDLENKEISVKTGIQINENIEYVPMGTFIIEKTTTKEISTKTQFTGYDYMIKFNVAYTDRVTYPIKAIEFLKDLCNQVGVACGSTEFTNSNYMILGNPFTNNEDCKTVLSNIAQLAGGFAYIGRDNKLYIKTLETTEKLSRVKDIHFMSVLDFNNLIVNTIVNNSDIADERIDGNNYFEFSKNNKFGKVNSLILRLSQIEGENTVVQDEESIKENGLTEITIADNYFLTNQVEREKVINELWEKLKGLEYLPFEIKDYGFPYLDLGDMICINDTEDKEYISYVFDYTFEYNGIYSGNLKAKALTKTQTAYKNTLDLKTKFKRTERVIDKINGKIEDIIEEQNDTENKLTKHEQDINSIKDSVSHIQNLTREIDGITTITLNDCTEGKLLELHILGNNTVFEYLYPNDELYPADNLYPYGDSRIVVTDSNNNQRIYELGIMDILRQNSEVYDEYILEKGQAKVIRRVNKDGTTKAKETIEDLGEFEISLKEGTNKITIQNYTARLQAKWAIKSDYTDIFATRVEMNSSINQTAQEINLEVKKKVDENEIISKINQSAEQIGIEANKINLKRKSIEFI